MSDFAAAIHDLLRSKYPLRQCKIDQVKVAILDTDVVKLEVPVAIAYLV